MTLEAGANQPPPLEPYDLFASDPVLGAAMEREDAVRETMAPFGKAVGSEEVFEWGSLTNRSNASGELEFEDAATLMMAQMSGAFDRAPTDPDEATFSRLATAVGKYWLTKRSSPVVCEALECVGGNGYVEESILPRLYREPPSTPSGRVPAT